MCMKVEEGKHAGIVPLTSGDLVLPLEVWLCYEVGDRRPGLSNNFRSIVFCDKSSSISRLDKRMKDIQFVKQNVCFALRSKIDIRNQNVAVFAYLHEIF